MSASESRIEVPDVFSGDKVACRAIERNRNAHALCVAVETTIEGDASVQHKVGLVVDDAWGTMAAHQPYPPCVWEAAAAEGVPASREMGQVNLVCVCFVTQLKLEAGEHF